MANNKLNLRFGIVGALIFMAALSRLLPHPPNFSPIGGIALFGAAWFSKKYWAVLIPVLAMWVSSLILDNIFLAQYYDGFVWFSHPFVYVSILLIVLFGRLVLKNTSPARLVGASLGASTIFYLVSNFGVWATSMVTYPKTLEGLMACYAAGLPFFGWTLAGDLFYVTVLFGTFEWVRRQYPTLVSETR
ncbi:MAG: hypothetical protein D6714_16110 [Bacteroidetes bacterium]|nr:MAG: hypothetical protein D6714_16110 [Bacteroidota bacterium]